MLNLQRNKDGFNIPKDYKVRPGTIDHGKEYEFKVAALLCVRCLGRETEEMWLAMNPEGCGAFDDVILCRKSVDGVVVTYFLQLKHQEREENLKPSDFRAVRGDFSLKKYFADIENLKDPKQNLQNPNQIFVLFTNKGTEDESYLEPVDDPVLNFINISGNSYKIIYSKIGRVLNKQEEEMVKHFFLFTKQLNVKNINEAIEDELLALFPHLNIPRKELSDLAEKFIFYVTEWSKGHLGGHYPLDKIWILKKISELLFEEYMLKFNDLEIADAPQQAGIWPDIAKKTPAMVIEQNELVTKFIKSYIHGIVSRRSQDIEVLWSNDLNLVKKNLMRELTVLPQIKYGDVYEYLWKNEAAPLILQISSLEALEKISRFIELCPGIFRVIILNASDVKLANEYMCANLADLSKKHQVKIVSRTVTLQGRALKLRDVVSDQFVHLITLKDIIHILVGEFNIGGEVNPLPQFFVERSIPKICLDSEVLEKITHEKFVIQCKSIADFQNFMTSQKLSLDTAVCYYDEVKPTLGCRIFITEHQDNFVQIPETIVHYLILHHSNHLEWVKSVGGIDNIQEFKIKTKVPLKPSNVKEMLKDVSSFPKLISSGPGMGKTVLLDYIALNAPDNLWLVVINLSKHCEYYNRDDFADLGPLEHLQYFHVNILSKQNVTKAIFQRHLENKTLFLLFDGYDEVPASFQAQVTQMIKSLHESDYNLCVATRPGVKNDLERIFSTFAVELNPFSRNEQIAFLLDFFGANLPDSNNSLIELFVEKLLNAAERNFDAFDKNFMGVPLQTKLLGEVFSQDCKIFVDTNQFSCERFDLLYLYRSFIKQKIRLVCDKYGAFNKDVYTDYKNYRSLLALKLLFDKNDLEELEIDKLLECTLKVMPNALQKLQKDGIVVAESKSNVTFTHRSFAEYLVAEWLSENLSEHQIVAQKLIRRLFDLNYTIIQNMFDRIFADGYELHSAIINGNFPLLQNKIKTDLDRLNQVDKGGRTFLHLMAAWGPRHPSQRGASSPKQFAEIFKHALISDKQSLGLLLTKVPSSNLNSLRDNVLGYTPLDYAIVRGSYDIADVICSKIEDMNNCISIHTRSMDKKLMDFYIAEFGYASFNSALDKHAKIEELTTVVNVFQALPSNSIPQSAARDNQIDELTNGVDPNDTDLIGFTVLHIAAMFDRLSVTNMLLSLSHTDINQKDDLGNSALHWAVALSHLDIIYELLRNGADTNVTERNGMSPLHYAIIATTNHQQQILKLLLDHHANPNIQDASGKTPLHHAVNYNQENIVNLLLDHISNDFELNLEVQDGNGKTALQWAMEKSHEGIVTLLITKGAYMDMTVTDIDNVIRKMCKNEDELANNMLILKWIKMRPKNKTKIEEERTFDLREPQLDDVPNQSKLDSTPLHQAVKSGNLSDILWKGVDLEAVDSNNHTPLHIAVLDHNLTVVSKLLSKGSNLEAKDNENRTPLHLAVEKEALAIVSELISKGANLEAKKLQNRTPLHSAAIMGHVSIVTELIDKGANLEAKDDASCTPLLYAVTMGHLAVISELLSKGADLEAKHVLNRTLLHVAADLGQVAVIELLSLDANLEANDIGLCTPLHVAAEKGNLAAVEHLISKGANIAAVDSHLFTPLQFAVEAGHTDVVAELLAKGADPNTRDDLNSTPLHAAAHRGYAHIALQLLSHGANLEDRGQNNCTALYVAASMGHVSVVVELASKGAGLETTGHRNRTALHLAAAMGHLDIVSILASKGANLECLDDMNRTPLHLAAKMGYVNVVAELVARGANLEAKGEGNNTPLLLAIEIGHLDVVSKLLDSGANLDVIGNEGLTALHFAVRMQHLSVVSELLTRGADCNIADGVTWTPLHWAAELGNVDIVAELLLKGAADLEVRDKTKSTAVHLAVLKGNFSVVSQLLSNGADIEARDDTDSTPLYLACGAGHLDIVIELLSREADLEASCRENRTALHCASAMGFVNVVSELISKGADLEVVDKWGRTPLHFAVALQRLDVVAKLLTSRASLEAIDLNGSTVLHTALRGERSDIVSLIVSWGADVNVRDKSGSTPLHIAARKGLLSNLELVLSSNVDINVKDGEGKTALSYAVKDGCVGIVRLLLSKGAELDENDENDYSSLDDAIRSGSSHDVVED